MKKYNWILVLLIIACLSGFYGYRTMEKMRSDTKAPEIILDAQLPEVSVADPKNALLQGITAKDNKDGDVTASLVVESIRLLDSDGRLSVGYAAFDSAGNVAKATREARYTDYRKPRFTMHEPLAYPYGRTFDILNAVGAEDVLDGDIQHRVRATTLDGKSIGEGGIHQVQFQVTNSLGDMETRVFPVEVYSADLYNAYLYLTDYLVYLKAGAAFNPKAYLKTFILQGDDIDLRDGLPEDFSLKTKGTVQTQYPGVYALEYRVTYTDRHDTNPELDREYTGYSKLIVIVEG